MTTEEHKPMSEMSLGELVTTLERAGGLYDQIQARKEKLALALVDRAYDMGLDEISALGPGPEKAIQLAVDGLATEGKHRKQWYLEEILIALGVDLADVWTKFEEYGYEEPDQGIAPQ